MQFNRFKSYQKLIKLREKPIDLSKNGVLTPSRIEKMQIESLGLKLLYGTERVTEDIMEALFDLAEESGAQDSMESMQAGEIINGIEGFESENRAVLHTAMRDFFSDRNPSKAALMASDKAFKEFNKLDQLMEQVDKKKITDIIQIGIGGSDLGPRALYVALERYHKPGRRAHFISNVDPDDATSVLNSVDLSKSIIVVVSKSGTTLETLTNESFVRDRLEKMGLDPKDHMIAVTGEGSPMDDPAKYLASFYIWDYVGGRYSATSMVGGVMLAFTIGMEEYKEILAGASEMDKHALSSDMHENLPLVSALLGIWNRNFLDLPTLAIIPYSQALLRFPAHLQQCDMESNGKQIDKKGAVVKYETGPIIWGEPGTNGQHSFYQLIHQGTTKVPLEFIGFRDSQYGNDLIVEGTSSQEKLLSNLFAQSIALAAGKKDKNPNKNFPGNRPNRILLAKHLDPRTMGKILSYYENKVAFQGFIWGINSFDQEGVQLGKVLAKKVLGLFGDKKESYPLGEAYVRALDSL